MPELRVRKDPKGVWEGTQKGWHLHGRGVGLHFLVRSLGAKVQRKGMAMMCSGNSLFLVKGIGRAQGASFEPTIHEISRHSSLASTLDSISEGHFHALVSVPSDSEPQTACHHSESKLQVKGLVISGL